MKIINLPQDILPDKKDQSESIVFFDYTAPAGSFKVKSVLHKNAISFVTGGEKIMQYADTTVCVRTNEFHFLSSGNCLVSINLTGKQLFSGILIFFDNNILADFYLKHHALISKIRARKKIINRPYIAFKQDAFVLNFMVSLKLLFKPGAGISSEMKLLKFEELMLHLIGKYPEEILSFQTVENQEFDDFEIRKAVETNILSNISIEELAFLCNISASTFKRRFLKVYGTSPNKWMVQKRMEIARDLLLHHHEKPGEVYHKVGYENHSSFTQSFKQTFGITPKELQQQHLNVQL